MGVSRIRGLTVTGGVALGGMILLAAGVLGVIETDGTGPAPDAGATQGRTGPLTGVQPALERALLTGNDLPVDGATGGPSPAGPPAATATPRPRPVAEGDEEPPAGSGECRALFEDPTRLAAAWPSVTPHEISARDTAGDDGSVLRQVLSVFDEEAVEAAYTRLGEAVAGCDEFPALLAGVPVKVLAGELGGGRREEGHAVGVTVIGEGERLVGWLAVDRIGPVISVLRHLRPEATPAAGTAAETRRTALGKLRPLLRFLDRDRPGGR